MNSNLVFSLKDISISFGKNEIFKDFNMLIHKRDFIALVGKNGVGKSTLMRIINGNQEIDIGEVWKENGLKVSYFNQHFDLNDSFTVSKELLNRLGNKDEDFKIDIFCDSLQIDKNATISTLSGGQKRRVGLIKSLIIDSNILLLDEPTNHLDLECIIWLENYLKNFNGSIICVSHDRTFLNNFTNKIFWIDRGNLRISPTGFKDFDKWSDSLFEQESSELKNRKQFVNIEVKWANRGVKARVKRNQKRLERAIYLKNKLEKDESSFRKAISGIKLMNLKPSSDSSKFIAEFFNASISYPNNEKVKIINNMSLKINRNDRIGLLGSNGTGKSTFLKALIGQALVISGSLKIKKDMNFSYFDQMRNIIEIEKSIKKILVPSGGDYLNVQGKQRHVCSYLKDFKFDPSKANESVDTLSGGQKNRLLLAKVLANPKTGLILDEPTNDLDLETMDLLTEMLSSYKGTLLIVSHDRDFLDQTVNKILHFEKGGKVSLYLGGFTDFMNNQELIKLNQKKKFNDVIKISKKEKIQKPKLSYKFQYELGKLPNEIQDIEIMIKKINDELMNSNLYLDNNDRFDNITKEFTGLKITLREKENRWIELTEMKENDQN